MFSSARSPLGLDPLAQIPPAELYNFHWTSLFADSALLAHAPLADRPVVLTLHDLNHITGGCHYTSGCDRFHERCGACPQLGSNERDDMSARGWQHKMDALSRRRAATVIVANSNWTGAQAAKSSLTRHLPIHVIRYGLDIDDFAPRDKRFARHTLGLPDGLTVILFAADDITNQRKGFSFLSEALQGINPEGKILISMGKGNLPPPPGWRHTHLGAIKNDRFLSIIYSAADIFVIPSLEEALGQTTMESMACGTPVVGFAAGGIPDLISEGRTGLLAQVGDAPGLRAAITRLLADEAMRASMAKSCRELMEREYRLESQARAYSALYVRILAGDTSLVPNSG